MGEFMDDAKALTLRALFSEPLDMRGDMKMESYTVELPSNTPGVSQSVLQVSSADDGWDDYKNLSWCPYAIMFGAHCGMTLPEHRYGQYWPFGRDPGDQPGFGDWIEGHNY